MRLRLRGERGMALVMAIGIMAVLSIAGTTAVMYSTSSAQQASQSRSRSNAFSLAWDDSTTSGEISWNATAKTLTVKGTIFIDGSAKVSQTANYNGQATLYLSGRCTSTAAAVVSRPEAPTSSRTGTRMPRCSRSSPTARAAR